MPRCLSLKAWTLILVASTFAIAEPKVQKMALSRRPRDTITYSRKRDPQSVTLTNAQHNGLYFVNASVGTPPQLVELQIDTGSSDVWMFGSSMYQNCEQCAGYSCE